MAIIPLFQKALFQYLTKYQVKNLPCTQRFKTLLAISKPRLGYRVDLDF